MNWFSLKNSSLVPIESSYPVKVLSFYNILNIAYNDRQISLKRIHPVISHVKAERDIKENRTVAGQTLHETF